MGTLPVTAGFDPTLVVIWIDPVDKLSVPMFQPESRAQFVMSTQLGSNVMVTAVADVGFASFISAIRSISMLSQ